MPRKRRGSSCMDGAGYPAIAATFSGNGFMPCFVTVWPRNSICVFPNWHLPGLTTKSYVASRRKSSRKCSVCSSKDRLADEHVVHVHEQVIEVTEDVVHHTLKRLSGVLKPERHSKKFKRSKRRSNHCFRDILLRYRYLMVPFDKVYLAENLPSVQACGKVGDLEV